MHQFAQRHLSAVHKYTLYPGLRMHSSVAGVEAGARRCVPAIRGYAYESTVVQPKIWARPGNDAKYTQVLENQLPWSFTMED